MAIGNESLSKFVENAMLPVLNASLIVAVTVNVSANAKSACSIFVL